MALVKTSNGIISIRGRYGGVYFKKGSDGQHVQAMPRTVIYARSGIQFAGVTRMSFASALWMLALLAFFGAAWGAYALVSWFTTRTGERKKITGYNWYLHYALILPETDRPPFWKPPHAPGELPQCICTYQGMWMYERGPDEWPVYSPADYYWFKGWYDDRPYFGTDDGKWFLWFKEGRWILSLGVGTEDPDFAFYSDGENIFSYYRNPVRKKWAHIYVGGGAFPD